MVSFNDFKRGFTAVVTGGLSEQVRGIGEGIDVLSGAKAMREQQRKMQRQAKKEQTALELAAEQEDQRQRRRRESMLRASIQPRAGLFDLLGSPQGRGTLG